MNARSIRPTFRLQRRILESFRFTTEPQKRVARQ